MKRREWAAGLKAVRTLFIAAAAVGVALPLGAQDAAPADTTPVPWSRLTVQPRFRDSVDVATVRYPDMLRLASVSGEVRLRLVLSDSGTPMPSATVEFSSHDLFTNNVRRAAGRWLFTPPELDGKPVRAELPVSVSFTIPDERDVPWRELSTVALDSLGVRAVVGWEPIPRDTSALDPADMKWAKLVALLQLLALNTGADTLAATCVGWGEKPNDVLPPTMMRRLRLQYDVVNADACPRTYWSMASKVKVPRGHVNPIWIRVSSVRAWTRDIYVMTGSISPAGGSHVYYCESRRNERGRWDAECQLRQSVMY